MSDNLPVARPQAPPAALVPGTVQDVLALADVLAKSGYFADARSAAQAAVKVLLGRELGFAPIASVVGVHVIDGKPSVGAHLMASMIKRSGKYDFRVVRCDREACKLQFLERRGAEWQALGDVEMTFQEAVDCGLAIKNDGKTLKSNWARSADDMLFARCVSKGFRRYCPDLTGGLTVYVDGEIEGPEAPALPGPALDAEPTFVALPAPVEGPSPNALAPTPAAASEPQPSPGLISEQDYHTLLQLYRDHRRTKEDGEKILAVFGVRKMADLPEEHLPRAKELLIQGPTTPELTDAISAEIQALGLPWEAFQARLRETTGVDTIGHLTRVQAEGVLARLRARRQPRPQPAA